MTRQFSRIKRFPLRTAAQRVVPPEFLLRMTTAHLECPWRGYSEASVVHAHSCAIRRGGACSCVPDVFITLPGGQLVEVDEAGRVSKATRRARSKSQLSHGSTVTLRFSRSSRGRRPRSARLCRAASWTRQRTLPLSGIGGGGSRKPTLGCGPAAAISFSTSTMPRR
jgi:hypothetical protein